MKVKVLKMGYASREVEVSPGTTVDEAIRSSGLDTGGCKITINGIGADLSAQVKDFDVIALVPKVEGGV